MITYKRFITHAKKLTTNESIKDREILQGIKHFEDGRVAVTDSHRLYVLDNLSEENRDIVLSVTGKEIEGNYPNIERLIPDKDYAHQSIEVDVKELLTAANIVAGISKTADPKNLPLTLFSNNQIAFNHEDVKFRYKLPFDITDTFALNAVYLLDAMRLLRAMKLEKVIFYYYGSMRPILIKASGIKIIILPIRRYD